MTNYGLFKSGRGGVLKQIKGNPRRPVMVKKVFVWGTSKSKVKSWIREWGTNTQKRKHL